MIFRQLFDATSSTYTYLLADTASREAILIDTVFENHERDLALIRELDLDLKYTVDTHAHADHVTGAWLMKQALRTETVLSKRYGAECVDLAIDHGDVIKFGDYAVTARATPGHTSGCLSFVAPNDEMVFTGDALLIRGAGRTDFQGGSARELYRSIREQIFTLPDACKVLPAHDYSGRTMSTVGEEKRFNARIGGNAREEDFVGFMNNLGLPHPKKIDIAVPANMKCGRPDDFKPERPTWGPVSMNYAGIPQVEPEWTYEHLDELHILDVRSQSEFDSEIGHLPDAQLIPIDELRDRTEEIPRDRPVVAVCFAGARSGQATKILQKAGFEDVANLPGGLQRWHDLGFPTVS